MIFNDAAQFGHSEETEELHYAINPDIPANIKGSKMATCITESAFMHFILGIENGQPIPIVKHPEWRAIQNQRLPSLCYASDPSAGLNTKDLKDLIQSKVRSAVKDSIRDFLPRILSTTPSGPSPPLSAPTNIIVPPAILQKFRKFTGNPNAQFKFAQQAELIVRMHSRQEHLLVIFPCGGGKTMLWLHQVKSYDSGMVTVVITPLNSLHDDLRLRCTRNEIKHLVYDSTIKDQLRPDVSRHCEQCVNRSRLCYRKLSPKCALAKLTVGGQIRM